MSACTCHHYTVVTLSLYTCNTRSSLVISDTALGVSYYNETVTLSLSKEEVIKSPGYPHTNYTRNTNYTWYVIASDETENISIQITTDIHEAPGFSCYDYLQVCDLTTYVIPNKFVYTSN